MKKVTEPLELPGGLHDEVRFTHPAFGQISASRVTGSRVLYGSDFVHQHFISITIRKSTLCRNLSRDWHFAGDEVIEVHLSEAQWATLVSSLNVGMGVPCTINHVDRVSQPDFPLRKQEDVVKQELHRTLDSVVADLEAAVVDIEGELGSSISGKKREAILKHLKAAQRKVGDHLPWAAKSFSEAMETTVERAKVEVNAYMQQLLLRTGLDALGATPPLQLTTGSETDDQT